MPAAGAVATGLYGVELAVSGAGRPRCLCTSGGTDGTANTGGGGGGAVASGQATTAGSGIVVVSYQISGCGGGSTGGTISVVGGFRIHKFTSGGTFTAASHALQIIWLLVAAAVAVLAEVEAVHHPAAVAAAAAFCRIHSQ